MSYFIGQELRLSCTFQNAAGANADPTTITLVVEGPGSPETTYTFAGGTIVKDSTGTYHKDITVSTAGTWQWRWVGTGTVASADQDAFVVEQLNV